MRPGHFWVCKLGDAGKLLGGSTPMGSPILAGPFAKRQNWPPKEGEAGWKEIYRGIPSHLYDKDDCALLVDHYYHRTADDPEGLTFVRWMGQQRKEILVINSSELRAVQGRQACDFCLTPPKLPQPLRQSMRTKKQQPTAPPPIDPKQRWRLDPELDQETRCACEAT